MGGGLEKERGKKDGKKGRAEVNGECGRRFGHPESPLARKKAGGEPARKP